MTRFFLIHASHKGHRALLPFPHCLGLFAYPPAPLTYDIFKDTGNILSVHFQPDTQKFIINVSVVEWNFTIQSELNEKEKKAAHMS